jgi:transglutaminase-like putative cysteine protease
MYQNGQRFSSNDDDGIFETDSGDLQVPPAAGRFEGDFEFTSGVQLTTIFAPSEPLWMSRDGRYQYLDNGDGTVDISSLTASPGLSPGQIYTVRAAVSAPTIAEMRAAGTEYPEWVSERYLQLPADVTPRTRELAQSITAGIDNPYDKVIAITTWLRENITYVETIEGNPAPGQEPVDWFLFDLKQGFCNYYATAEIVLLRSVGIPARWSIGYAQGELLEQDDSEDPQLASLTYLVRNRDAHSWPEVYFPGMGWVEFEPTVSQPDILRPASNDPNAHNHPSSGAGLN